MKVLGRRHDGVIYVNVGSQTVYAVDLAANYGRGAFAYVGDGASKLVQRTALTPIDKADDVSTVHYQALAVLNKGQRVDLEFIPFDKKPADERRTCDADTTLADDEECVDGYIQKKKSDNPFAKA